jgi:plastocyanin
MRLCLLPAVATAAALAAVPPASATTHIVTQMSLSFSPNSITIEVGDTVQWVWSAGSHTVTSGTGPTDPQAGALFNSALSAAVPSFSFVFNSPGDVPYFCSPHFNFGMTGVVHVNQPTATPEPEVESATWGRVKDLYR